MSCGSSLRVISSTFLRMTLSLGACSLKSKSSDVEFLGDFFERVNFRGDFAEFDTRDGIHGHIHVISQFELAYTLILSKFADTVSQICGKVIIIHIGYSRCFGNSKYIIRYIPILL